MSDESREERYQRIARAKRVDLDFMETSVLAHVGMAIADLTPITKGESNAVFDVELSDSRRLIARMHFDSEKRWFEKEAAVLHRLAGSEVPVPDVIALTHRDADDGVFSLCLQTPVAGRPYLDLLIEDSMSAASHARVMDQIRKMLEAIHAVEVSGISELLPVDTDLLGTVEGYVSRLAVRSRPGLWSTAFAGRSGPRALRNNEMRGTFTIVRSRRPREPVFRCRRQGLVIDQVNRTQVIFGFLKGALIQKQHGTIGQFWVSFATILPLFGL